MPVKHYSWSFLFAVFSFMTWSDREGGAVKDRFAPNDTFCVMF